LYEEGLFIITQFGQTLVFGTFRSSPASGSLNKLGVSLIFPENLLNGSDVDFAISTIKFESNSRFTWLATLIASTKENAN